MRRIIYGLKVLWGYWYFILFVLFFLIFYPLFFLLLSSPKGYAAANNLRRFWAVIVLLLCGMPWRIKHEKKHSERGVIYCPNHFSYLDIPMVMFSCSGNLRFMAKIELGNIPIFNIFFKTVDIPVNRGSRVEAYKAIKQAEESLDQGYNLVVFPEGTIGHHPPNLLHFKNGPFRLAIEKQVPIVPVTFINNWQHLHVEKKIWGKPGLLKAVVHQPISTKGMRLEDAGKLRDEVYQVINNELKKHWNSETAESHNFALHESRRQTR